LAAREERPSATGTPEGVTGELKLLADAAVGSGVMSSVSASRSGFSLLDPKLLFALLLLVAPMLGLLYFALPA